LGDFVIGANLPWNHYGHDFGRAWGDRGVGASRSEVEADFEALLGTDVVRWFVYADGRALDHSEPEDVLADLDVALEIAELHGVKLMPVLFDFKWFQRARQIDGVQLFGRRDLVVDPVQRAELIARWVEPLAVYGDDPRIFAFDIINEPEWAISDGVHRAIVGEPITLEQMWDFVFDVAAPLRDGRPLTVGSAKFEDLRAIWADAPLDLLQVHDYGLRRLPPADELGTELPVLVGEFATKRVDVARRVERYEALGYDGALPWSLNGDDRATSRASLADFLGN
ncbi:MAG: hypothetical protein AAF602_04210, partial [Myxococcota bacterium]